MTGVKTKRGILNVPISLYYIHDRKCLRETERWHVCFPKSNYNITTTHEKLQLTNQTSKCNHGIYLLFMLVVV